MKLCFVSTILQYPWGGADKLWSAAAARAQTEGHGLMVALSALTADHVEIRQLIARGARLHLRKDHTDFRGHRQWLWQRAQDCLHFKSSLIAWLNTFSPDHVVITQGGLFDIVLEDGLVHWLERHGIPYSLICQSAGDQDTLSAADRPRVLHVFRRAHAVVFVSTHNCRVAEQLLGEELSNAQVVQNPSTLQFTTPLPWPDLLVARMAVVARLETRDKALDTLFDAVAEALGAESGWQLDVFGEGKDESTLREQVRKLGLSDRVVFRGFCSDLPTLWRNHHLLLLPSHREGCSIAMLEALRCGRPVLVTPVGGVEDWIVPGLNGFVSPASDTVALAGTLRTAWAERSRWPAMGAAAAGASSRFDPAPDRTLLQIIVSDGRTRSRRIEPCFHV